jgi:hypothetical protein
VLIADDVADSGQTIELVYTFIRDHVAVVRSAVIYEKPRSLIRCDYVWEHTGRWINFPVEFCGSGRPARWPGHRRLTRAGWTVLRCWLDRVPGGFSGVLPSGGGGPAEGSRGDLLDFPAGVLLEAMVVTAGRPAVARTGPAACLIGDVVFEVAVAGWSSAGRGDTGGVPDLGQVAQLDPRIMAAGLEPVVACLLGDRVHRDDQVRLAGDPGGKSPGAIPAGRPVITGAGEGEPRRRVTAGSALIGPFEWVRGCGVRVGRSRGRWRVRIHR